MSLFGWAKKIDPQEAFDTVASGIDKVFYTNEEKAEAAAKAFDQYMEWFKLASDENSARSITRRYLAVMFAGVFLFLLLASGAVWLFNADYASFLAELAKTIAPYVGGIMAFYFGYYAISNVIESTKKSKKINHYA